MAIPIFIILPIFRASLKLNIMPPRRGFSLIIKKHLCHPPASRSTKEYLVGPSKYSFGSQRYEGWENRCMSARPALQRRRWSMWSVQQHRSISIAPLSLAPSASLHQLLLDDCSGFSRMAHELAETTLPRRWMRQVYVPSLNSLATSRRSDL